jgi:heat shock protein HtpX
MFFNTIKTISLLILLSFICIAIGSLFGRDGLHIALVMAVVMNFFIYFYSDKMVLRMYNAQPLDPNNYHHIHEMIEDLAYRMNIPKPRVWLIQSSQANAFATGRNPKHASVALTTEIISILDEAELRGVLAHELSHIKNRDILISTIAATIASFIGYLSYTLRYSALWGAQTTNRKQSSSQNNPLILFIAGLILPFLATLIQLAISRSREYQADESGARITQDPLSLASALKKLELHIQYTKQEYNYRPANALGIVHQFCGKKYMDLLSTHPPMEKRITRLHELYRKLF